MTSKFRRAGRIAVFRCFVQAIVSFHELSPGQHGGMLLQLCPRASPGATGIREVEMEPPRRQVKMPLLIVRAKQYRATNLERLD